MKKSSEPKKRSPKKKDVKKGAKQKRNTVVASKNKQDSLDTEQSDGLSIQHEELSSSTESNDELTLSRAKTYWIFAEWDKLAELDLETIRYHPDRDRLAILAASAYQQLGNNELARQYTQISLKWGCPPQVVAQVLIASVHNTLGRAAALRHDEERIKHHFESSISVAGSKDTNLMSHSRAVREMTRMGLLHQVAGLIDEQLENTSDASQLPGLRQENFKVLQKEVVALRQGLTLFQQQKRSKIEEKVVRLNKNDTTTDSGNTIYNSSAYSFYQNISQTFIKTGENPFILIDSKSLPRSGLHYMRSTLAGLLQDHFSFCEWYNEPGCCKRMPCSLTGYAQKCNKMQTSGLRLTKSHDFELTDPVYEPVYSARRIILVRSPLFLLTSYFALEQLMQYKPVLEQNGIKMAKIWLSHEPEVLATAYQLMDETFVAPDIELLTIWLENKTRYISRFLDKWATPAIETPQSFLQVVRYEEINSFISGMLDELQEYLPDVVRQGIADFTYNDSREFSARRDPYKVPSKKLSIYLAENSNLFVEAARKIVEADRCKVLGNDDSN